VRAGYVTSFRMIGMSRLLQLTLADIYLDPAAYLNQSIIAVAYLEQLTLTVACLDRVLLPLHRVDLDYQANFNVRCCLYL
jgi:hypothetical protein